MIKTLIIEDLLATFYLTYQNILLLTLCITIDGQKREEHL